jgi:formate dehydrogenase subunit gamma
MPLRSKACALALLVAIFTSPAWAQPENTAPNPTAQSIPEQQLLKERRRIEGRVTIPDRNARILEQPQGRQYQAFHEHVLPRLAGAAIILTLVALAAFYARRGPITLDRPLRGVKITRFSAFERFTHWLTASSFIVLAVTGLNFVFGKRLLMPLIGDDAFSAWTQWAKYAHDAVAWPFVFGLAMMIVLWIGDNLPDRYDREWLKQFGGFLSNRHLPAGRFNAGQKLIYWSVVLGGLALTASGLVLMFPYVFDIAGIQFAQYVHAVTAAILTAVILAHIYIGTLGMQGALESMISGEVDLAWAEQHHSAWLADNQPYPADGHLEKRSIPAE